MSTKISLAKARESASKTVKRYVEKTIKWEEVDEEGNSHHYEGTVDILVAGQRAWGATKDFIKQLEEKVKAGEDPDPIMIVEMVSFDGEHMDYDLAKSIPGTMFLALINAITEVNPQLKQKAEKPEGKS